MRRMLGLEERRQHPGDRRQLARGAVGLEVGRVGRRDPLRLQRRVGLEVAEVREHVLEAPRDRRGVDLPGDAARLELLRVGRPGEAAGVLAATGDERLEQRTAVLSGRVEHPRHRVEPVRVGRADHRAEEVVAEREVVGQREVEAEVLALVVAHRERGLLGAVDVLAREVEAVHLPAVPRPVLGPPLVVDVVRALGDAVEGVEVVREDLPVEARRLVAGLREVPAPAVVREAAHAPVRAEVVVERAVLVHQDHDVLDVLEAPAARAPRQRVEQGRIQAGQSDRRAAGGPRPQEVPPRQSGVHVHVRLPR